MRRGVSDVSKKRLSRGRSVVLLNVSDSLVADRVGIKEIFIIASLVLGIFIVACQRVGIVKATCADDRAKKFIKPSVFRP